MQRSVIMQEMQASIKAEKAQREEKMQKQAGGMKAALSKQKSEVSIQQDDTH